MIREERRRDLKTGLVLDLTDERRRSLERTRQSIDDMEAVLRGMALEHPRRVYVIMLLKSLYAAERRLAPTVAIQRHAGCDEGHNKPDGVADPDGGQDVHGRSRG